MRLALAGMLASALLAPAAADALISDDPEIAQDTLAPTALLSAPTFSSDRSRTRRFRVRWRAVDRDSGVARYTVEVVRNALTRGRWRGVVRETTRRSVLFRGRPGATYLFRLRARDRDGNVSRYTYDLTTVPLDERSSRVVRSRGWRRILRRKAYGGTMLRTRRPGRELSLGFTGSRVALIARRSRRGARLEVRVGGRARAVTLRGKPGYRRVVFRSREMRPGRHVVRVRSLSRGPADIDAFAVRAGPPVTRR